MFVILKNGEIGAIAHAGWHKVPWSWFHVRRYSRVDLAVNIVCMHRR